MNVSHGLRANVAGCRLCFRWLYFYSCLYKMCICIYESRKCLLMRYVLPVSPAMFQLCGGDVFHNVSDFKGLNIFSKYWLLSPFSFSPRNGGVYLIYHLTSIEYTGWGTIKLQPEVLISLSQVEEEQTDQTHSIRCIRICCECDYQNCWKEKIATFNRVIFRVLCLEQRFPTLSGRWPHTEVMKFLWPQHLKRMQVVFTFN